MMDRLWKKIGGERRGATDGSDEQVFGAK